MTRWVQPGLVALALWGLGCAREGERDSSLPADVEIGSAPASTARSDVSAGRVAGTERAEQGRLVSWTLPDRAGAQLGSACPTSPATGPAAPVVAGVLFDACGNRGRVSVEVQSFGALRDVPPCTMRRLAKSPDKPGMNAITACVEGDRIVVNSSCMFCRQAFAGTAVLARLSELTPDQNKWLQAVADLRDGPSTPEEWRAAVDAGQPDR